jgi:hypothetical protein
MTWNVYDADDVSSSSLTVDGSTVSLIYGPYADTTGSDYAGMFGALTVGSHSYKISATDALGIASDLTGTFAVESAKPAIDHIVVAAERGLITWNAFDANGVASVGLTVDGTAATLIYGPFTAAIGVNYAGALGVLAEGSHDYAITVTDTNGNTSKSTGTFTVEAADPVVDKVVVVADRGLITWNAFDADGVDNVHLTIDGADAAKMYGPFTAPIGLYYGGSFDALSAGSHSYAIEVADKDGNVSQSSGTFNVAAKLMVAANISSTVNSPGNSVGKYDSAGLTDEKLQTIVHAAKQRLAAVLGAQVSERLANVAVDIADLAEGVLGETSGNTIQIDRDASGYGWFVDETPGEDGEYTGSSTGGALMAAKNNAAASNRVDLLTTVMHELGHVLGYADDQAGDWMNGSLSLGMRRLIAFDQTYVEWSQT